jgi:hypothetical protein
MCAAYFYVWGNAVKGYQLLSGLLPGFTLFVLTSQVGWAGTVNVTDVEPLVLQTMNGSLEEQLSAGFGSGDGLGDLADFSFGNRDLVSMLINPDMFSSSKLPQANSDVSFSPKDSVVLEPDNGVGVTKIKSQTQVSMKKVMLPASWEKIVNSQKKISNPNSFLDTHKTKKKANLLISHNSDQKCDKSKVYPVSIQPIINSSVAECGQFSIQKVAGIESIQLAQTNPKVPAKTPTPVVTPDKPKPPSGSTELPAYLRQNPNLLQFPTQPGEVQLKAEQPLSLDQALEIARRYNRELQLSLLQTGRSALRQQQASLFPSLNLNTTLSKQQADNFTSFSSGTSFNTQLQMNYTLYTLALDKQQLETLKNRYVQMS